MHRDTDPGRPSGEEGVGVVCVGGGAAGIAGVAVLERVDAAAASPLDGLDGGSGDGLVEAEGPVQPALAGQVCEATAAAEGEQSSGNCVPKLECRCAVAGIGGAECAAKLLPFH